MIPILVAATAGLLCAGLGTPLFIKVLVKKGYGQFIRDDGPTSHHTKRGTPTMGGVVIIASTWIAYLVAHALWQYPPSISGLLVMLLMTGLGLVGFLDDFLKISKQRSLGLQAWAKLLGQGLVATVFALLALQFPDESGRTPANAAVSFFRDTELDFTVWGPVLGLLIFIVWCNFLVAAWSNAVNLTDGLDGLATGASIVFFGAYILIGFWQRGRSCGDAPWSLCYEVRDPLDIAVLCSAIVGACIGFLWWNTSPAKIFMGDTGSLALGGAIAGVTMVTRTELLGAVIGGLFVVVTLSVIIQVVSFKTTGKRVFRMAPLQHHFELKGWGEVTIVVRFWIVALLCAGLGLGLFYAEVLPEIV